MAYWLDDNWEGSPQIRQVGLTAWGLYCACGLYVARHCTDGHVPREVASAYGTAYRKWAQKLIESGLWERTKTGYYMPHYLNLNPTAERVAQQRKLHAERQAAYRRRCSK